jgi:signal transduction histidine kinase
VATLPAFLFVVTIASSERRSALRKAEAEARHAATLASREHAHQIAGVRRLLERLAPEADLLPSILAGFPQVANIGILDRSGNVIYSVVTPPRKVVMAESPAFAEALRTGEVAIGQYQIGQIVGRPILLMMRATQDGRVLFAALELTWLDELARQANLPPATSMFIADRSGTIVAGAPPRRIAAFEELTRKREGMVPIDDRLFVAVPLRDANGLWVVVGAPEASIRSAANRIFFRDLAALALFAAFAIAASIVAADVSVLRDLRLLARATRTFGSGDLSARSPVPNARGEIRELTTAFNSMASAIETRDATLRALSHRLESIREEEARRIAQELHDELGQQLTVLRMDLESLRRRTAMHAPIDAMCDMVGEALQSVRRIASELRPGVLDRLGLTEALEWLARELERRSSIAIELRAAHLDDRIDAETATTLFRVAQEAMTNVLRHSQAATVVVELQEHDEAIVLRIRDDGRGFDAKGVSRTSLGLVGMRERVARIGGTLDIVSAPGQGTELIAIVSSPEKEDLCIAS